MTVTAIDWGDAPTWLATSGAFLAAWYAARAFRSEQRRDDALAAQLLQLQASLVAVWDAGVDDVEQNNPWGRDFLPAFRLRNASELPVYDVLVFSHAWDWNEPERFTPAGVWTVDVLPPSGEPVRRFAIEGGSRAFRYGMQFRDAAGRNWHRDVRGVLGAGPHPNRELYEDRLWDEDW